MNETHTKANNSSRNVTRHSPNSLQNLNTKRPWTDKYCFIIWLYSLFKTIIRLWFIWYNCLIHCEIITNPQKKIFSVWLIPDSISKSAKNRRTKPMWIVLSSWTFFSHLCSTPRHMESWNQCNKKFLPHPFGSNHKGMSQFLCLVPPSPHSQSTAAKKYNSQKTRYKHP